MLVSMKLFHLFPSLEMHEKTAGSKLVILPNEGHMNFVDQPVMWQRAVEGFLGEN